MIRLDGKFAQVLELYEDDGAGPTRNAKSRRNHGMASYRLLDANQVGHGHMGNQNSNANKDNVFARFLEFPCGGSAAQYTRSPTQISSCGFS